MRLWELGDLKFRHWSLSQECDPSPAPEDRCLSLPPRYATAYNNTFEYYLGETLAINLHQRQKQQLVETSMLIVFVHYE